MSLTDFLLWAGSAAGAGAIANFLLARMAWYVNLSSDQKQWTFFGICAFLSTSAYAVITYVPSAVLSQIAPFFAIIASAFVTTFVGQAFNRLDRVVNKLKGD